MICIQCGMEFEDTDKFCFECGSKNLNIDPCVHETFFKNYFMGPKSIVTDPNNFSAFSYYKSINSNSAMTIMFVFLLIGISVLFWSIVVSFILELLHISMPDEPVRITDQINEFIIIAIILFLSFLPLLLYKIVPNFSMFVIKNNFDKKIAQIKPNNSNQAFFVKFLNTNTFEVKLNGKKQAIIFPLAEFTIIFGENQRWGSNYATIKDSLNRTVMKICYEDITFQELIPSIDAKLKPDDYDPKYNFKIKASSNFDETAVCAIAIILTYYRGKATKLGPFILCPRCNSKLDKKDNFCHECDYELSKIE